MAGVNAGNLTVTYAYKAKPNLKCDGFLAKTLIYITTAIISPAGKRKPCIV